jgi:hypothetical protein
MTDNPMWMRGMAEACLDKAPAADIHRLAEQAENELLPKQNPELKYQQGALLLHAANLRLHSTFLRQAVAGNYCAHQALQSDPLLASVRGPTPNFAALCKPPRSASRNSPPPRGCPLRMSRFAHNIFAPFIE